MEDRKSKRKILFERDSGKCCFCSTQLTLKSMTLEHIIPQSKKGSDDIENLTISCFDCNNKRGDTDFDTFMKRNSPPKFILKRGEVRLF